MMKNWRGILSLLLAALLLAAVVPPAADGLIPVALAVSQKDIDKLKENKKDLTGEKKDIQNQLSQLKNDKDTAIQRRTLLDQEISITEREIKNTEDQISGYEALLSQTALELEKNERETDKLKKVEYMEDYIDECFDGVISGVTSWGIYVELPNTVEGLIHVSKLPGDYYYYDESKCEMVGEATGRTFKLGMPVRVRVEGCDRFNRTIDFGFE